MPQEQKKIFRKQSRKLRGNLNKRNKKQQQQEQQEQQQQQQQGDNIVFNPSQVCNLKNKNIIFFSFQVFLYLTLLLVSLSNSF
jgi:hypothetical protein